MNRRWLRGDAALVAAVVPVVLVAGCASNAPGDLTGSAAKVLRPAVEDVRQAAAGGSYSELRQAVQRLKDLVSQEEQAGEVSSQRGVAIENAADVLLQDARPKSSPSPTPTTESPTPTLTTESPTPTPTPTTASPTPSETSASPSPTASVTVSAVAGGLHHGKPTSSPSP